MLSFSAFHSHAVVLLVSFQQKSGFIFEVAKMSPMHISFSFVSKSPFKPLLFTAEQFAVNLLWLFSHPSSNMSFYVW